MRAGRDARRARWVRITPIWTRAPCRPALNRPIGLAGNWGRIVVYDGGLRFIAATSPAIEFEPGARATQVIPPGVEHDVEPLGTVQFTVEFFAVDRGGQRRRTKAAMRHAGQVVSVQSVA